MNNIHIFVKKYPKTSVFIILGLIVLVFYGLFAIALFIGFVIWIYFSNKKINEERNDNKKYLEMYNDIIKVSQSYHGYKKNDEIKKYENELFNDLVIKYNDAFIDRNVKPHVIEDRSDIIKIFKDNRLGESESQALLNKYKTNLVSSIEKYMREESKIDVDRKEILRKMVNDINKINTDYTVSLEF